MNTQTTHRDADGRKKTWKLVWSDEFEQDGVPDPAKWMTAAGFLRNREPQYYQKQNAYVKDDCLVLEARRETVENAAYDPSASEERWQKARKTAEYTSGEVETRMSASWLYGRIEVRAKIPGEQGAWPAIWMLGTAIRDVGWPKCGEIDIMENWQIRNREDRWTDPENIHATMHWYDPELPPHKSSNHGEKIRADVPWDDFHVYAAEWDTEKIVFFYDSTPYFTFSLDETETKGIPSPFRKPHFLLLNLALSPDNPPDENTVFPIRYLIDYVRVYEAL